MEQWASKLALWNMYGDAWTCIWGRGRFRYLFLGRGDGGDLQLFYFVLCNCVLGRGGCYQDPHEDAIGDRQGLLNQWVLMAKCDQPTHTHMDWTQLRGLMQPLRIFNPLSSELDIGNLLQIVVWLWFWSQTRLDELICMQ